MGHEIIKFDVTEAAIKKMESVYMNLIVKDVNDKEGFKAVHDARMVVVKHRTGVEKHRKFLKADALAYGRKVDATAKEIFVRLAPMESYLTEQEKIVTDEKKRQEEEKARLFEEKINDRMTALATFNQVIPYQEVAMMSDDEFDKKLSEIREANRIEQERIAEEKRIGDERLAEIEAKQKAEAERLAKIAKEQAEAQAEIDAESVRIAAELQAKLDAIDAKEREVQAEKDRLERIEFEKKAREEARIQAEADAKEAAERAEWDRKAKEDEEAAAVARAEALKPDKQKLKDFAEKILNLSSGNINVHSEDAKGLYDATLRELIRIYDKFLEEIEDL